MLPENLKSEILKRLKPLNLEKIILFGSYAYGKPSPDSDIDIYIVTKDEFIPANWDEKTKLYLNISNRIRDIRKKNAIDLIVHTKKMHEKFLALDSSFSREIKTKGISLL